MIWEIVRYLRKNKSNNQDALKNTLSEVTKKKWQEVIWVSAVLELEGGG